MITEAKDTCLHTNLEVVTNPMSGVKVTIDGGDIGIASTSLLKCKDCDCLELIITPLQTDSQIQLMLLKDTHKVYT